jgi:hypothetical protein
MGVELLESLCNTLGHCLLAFTNPDTWVVVLLIWLVWAVWVANLVSEVVLLVEDVVTDAGEVAVGC